MKSYGAWSFRSLCATQTSGWKSYYCCCYYYYNHISIWFTSIVPDIFPICLFNNYDVPNIVLEKETRNKAQPVPTEGELTQAKASVTQYDYYYSKSVI